jgi:cytochrome c-type biogenesis protein CcmH/NrfG
MVKNPSSPTDTVKKSTLYGAAAVCLAVGFFAGVVFSIYKTSDHTLPAPVPQPSPPSVDRSQQLQALTRETTANPQNVSAWIDLGNLYFDTNQFDKAIRAYQKALGLDPKNANVWTDLGVMHRRSGNPEAAVDAFDEAMRVDPEHEVSRFNKGIVLMHDLKDPPGAVKAWENLLEINPLAMAPGGRSVDELVTAIKKQMQRQK